MSSGVVHIVDDDSAMREVLARLLALEGIAAQTYASGQAFLTACEAGMRGCVLLDIHLPDMDGMAIQQALLERGIGLPVIFLTGHGDVPLSSQAFRLGAVDFLQKPIDSATLLARVREALAADFSQRNLRLRQRLLGDRVAKLTAREKEVLEWVAEGYSSKQIARQLSISHRTVEVYRASLMDKLQAKSIADLIVTALSMGKPL